MDAFDLYERTLLSTGDLIRTVTPDQYTLATPCAAYDVRGLMNHVAAVPWLINQMLDGKSVTWDDVDESENYLGDDPSATYDQLTSRVIEANKANLSEEARKDPEQAGGGHLLDNLIHQWDLAKAIGAPTQLDAECVEVGYQLALVHITDDARSDGPTARFGPAIVVGDDASLQDRLLAHTGRQP